MPHFHTEPIAGISGASTVLVYRERTLNNDASAENVSACEEEIARESSRYPPALSALCMSRSIAEYERKGSSVCSTDVLESPAARTNATFCVSPGLIVIVHTNPAALSSVYWGSSVAARDGSRIIAGSRLYIGDPKNTSRPRTAASSLIESEDTIIAPALTVFSRSRGSGRENKEAAPSNAVVDAINNRS
ncbi:MAG: hypothetical protein ACD_81C00169G0002 [uncultured bacterium]|nr:MAG: hypothetical protein ACD_81C00169G0002 [uncultured bacterium]